MLKAILFDRDGVLIKNYGYLIDVKKIKWLKGSIQAIKKLNYLKIKVIVITNQSGVARGYFSEKQLKEFHIIMNKVLKKKNAKIDFFFYCPYHIKGIIKKYKKKTNLRKPGDGMIKLAMKKFNFKSSECLMIGDQKSDYLAAKKSKIGFEYKKNYSLELQIQKILDKYL